MASAVRKHLEHRGGLISKGGELSLYFVKETILRTFEAPVIGDFIEAISVEGDDQTPEQLVSEARSNTDRMRKATLAGRIDHGEKTLRFEIRPPGQLTGADTMMGEAVLEALFGAKNIVNSQTAVAITTVDSHSRSGGTVITLVAAESAFLLGDVVAIRSQNAESVHLDHKPSYVHSVAFPGGGNLTLTLMPALPSEPIIGGSPDKIQGGVTFKPTADWFDTWSALWTQGFDGDQAEGGVVNSGTFNIDGRSIYTADFGFHYRKSQYSAVGFIKGEGVSSDAITTANTDIRVDDAGLYKEGAFLDIVKFNVTTDLETARETKALVTAINKATNRITLTRGSTPVDQTGGTHDLTPTTLTTTHQKTMTTINVIANDFIRIELDHRGSFDVPLTINAAATATDIVADINAALQYAERYGQAVDAPFSDADWAAAASVAPANEVNLLSQAAGKQAQVKFYITGLSGDRGTDIWVPASTTEILADSDLQLVPWTPLGSDTKTPLVNKDGLCRVGGYELLLSQGTVSIDNTAEHIEDVKTGDDFESSHLSGRERLTQAAITIPAWGWSSRIKAFEEDNTTHPVGFIVGDTEGGTFSIFFTKATFSGRNKSGDNRQDVSFTLTAEDPKVTVTNTAGTVYILREVVAGIT